MTEDVARPARYNRPRVTFKAGDLIGGRYRLVRPLGAGAMGMVWSARNELTERDFAIKLMIPSKRDERRSKRFLQEAKAAGRLRHRSIIEVYDVGRLEDDTPFLVMELLDGEPLDALLRRTGDIPAGTALRIVRDVARALVVAHDKHIIHRDLKPGNLFLHRPADGGPDSIVPKVLDFGVSKLIDGSFDAVETTMGTVMGSPAYMSPEQTRGEIDIDGRSDLWSLGVILYKCLTGVLPFRAPTYASLVAVIAEDPHPRLADFPEPVSRIVDRCLEKRARDRYQSAAELADAIDDAIATHSLPTLQISQMVLMPTASTGSVRTVVTAPRESVRTKTLLSETKVHEPTATRPQTIDRAGATGMSASLAVIPVPRPSPRPWAWRASAIVAAAACVAVFVLARGTPQPHAAAAAAEASAPAALEGPGLPAATTSATPIVPAVTATLDTKRATTSEPVAEPPEPAPVVMAATAAPTATVKAKNKPKTKTSSASPPTPSATAVTTAHAHEGVSHVGF